jgi:uncharacterized cupredoxin-like copper-binding protein
VRGMKALRLSIAPLAAVLAFGTAGCGGDAGEGDGDEGGGGATVRAVEKDFSISLSPGSTAAGGVTFDIRNDGPSEHEFVVFRSDLSPNQLPTTKDDNDVTIVDEEGEGLEPVDEQEDIAAGDTATLTVDLQPGNYVVVCNLPAHYQQGMHAQFTVT